MPYQFSVNYWRNNKQFLTFLSFIIIVNIVLFVTRAYYFRDFSMLSGARPNPFYMISRANGKYIDLQSSTLASLCMYGGSLSPVYTGRIAVGRRRQILNFKLQ